MNDIFAEQQKFLASGAPPSVRVQRAGAGTPKPASTPTVPPSLVGDITEKSFGTPLQNSSEVHVAESATEGFPKPAHRNSAKSSRFKQLMQQRRQRSSPRATVNNGSDKAAWDALKLPENVPVVSGINMHDIRNQSISLLRNMSAAEMQETLQSMKELVGEDAMQQLQSSVEREAVALRGKVEKASCVTNFTPADTLQDPNVQFGGPVGTAEDLERAVQQLPVEEKKKLEWTGMVKLTDEDAASVAQDSRGTSQRLTPEQTLNLLKDMRDDGARYDLAGNVIAPEDYEKLKHRRELLVSISDVQSFWLIPLSIMPIKTNQAIPSSMLHGCVEAL